MTSATAPMEHPPSKFMAMPRELRDQVYDNLGQDINLGNPFSKVPPWDAIATQVSVIAGPCAALLRVSKQFSDEYEQRIRPLSALVIKDRTCTRYIEAAVPMLEAPMKQIRHVKLEFLVPSTARNRFARIEQISYNWAERLQSLSLHTLSAQVVIEVRSMHECYYPDGLPTMPLSDVDQFGIEEVELRCRAASLMKDEGDPATVYGTWTRKQGWKSGKSDRE